MEDNDFRPSHLKKLEEEFAVVDDITDPSWMDCILHYLEQVQAEDEAFLEALLSVQHEMVITWAQPWYQCMNGVSRPLEEPANDKLEKFRTDTICFEESNKIHKNWKKFRKIFGLPNRPDCLARWRNKEFSKNPNSPEEYARRYVISFLAQGLERNLYQVFRHFIVKYSTPIKNRYLKYEENIMDIVLYHNPKNCVPILTLILGREPRGLYKRLLRQINGSTDRKYHKWTLERATKLLHLLMKYTGESFHNLKNKRFDKSVWLQLGDDLDHYYLYVQDFWYKTLHVQLFVKYDVKIKRLRKKLLKQIKRNPYKVWRDIRWKEIAKEYPDGFTHRFLYTAIATLVRCFDGYHRTPLQDLIDNAVKKAKSLGNRRLRTLALNDNHELEIIKYDIKYK